MNITIDIPHLRLYEDGREIPLTLLEWRIVLALVQVGGGGITYLQLARAIYGTDSGVSRDSMHVTVSRLRKKFSDPPIQTLKRGLVWSDRDGAPHGFFSMRVL